MSSELDGVTPSSPATSLQVVKLLSLLNLLHLKPSVVLTDSLIPSVEEGSTLSSKRQHIQFESVFNVAENFVDRLKSIDANDKAWLSFIEHFDYRYTLLIESFKTLDERLHIVVRPA